MGIKVKLIDSPEDPVRLSFPDLFEPVEFQPGDKKPRYNASFLVTPGKANAKRIEAAIDEALKAEFDTVEKAAAKRKVFEKGGDTCWADGDGKEYAGYEGMMVLSSHRRAQDGPVGVYDIVGTYDEAKKKVVPNKLDANSGKPYGGCYVNATVEIYIQSGKFPGIRAGLQSVQYARQGDSFGGARPATPDDFDAVDQAEGADAEEIV